MVFSNNDEGMRSIVSKNNPKWVINHACRAFYMLKKGVFGLMENICGPLVPNGHMDIAANSAQMMTMDNSLCSHLFYIRMQTEYRENYRKSQLLQTHHSVK